MGCYPIHMWEFDKGRKGLGSRNQDVSELGNSLHLDPRVFAPQLGADIFDMPYDGLFDPEIKLAIEQVRCQITIRNRMPG